MKKGKPKKEKITYIDDGRTIADMSGVSDRHQWTKRGTTASPKEIWRTYWSAVRMMLKPTLAIVGFIAALYLIVSLIFLAMR